jgi:hypothetical protein
LRLLPRAGIFRRVKHHVFLLSPANTSGRRCQILLAERAQFDLAQRVRDGGAPIGEVMSFMSQLYFRGKVNYALAFASPPPNCQGALVITPGRGLVPLDEPITTSDLRAFASVPVDHANPDFREPLERDALKLRDRAGPSSSVVLLGSIASSKYVEVLLRVFGEALLFPSEFVGRGDMSRGGLMLRSAETRAELAYRPLSGAERRGKRPPRLPKLARKATAAIRANRER